MCDKCLAQAESCEWTYSEHFHTWGASCGASWVLSGGPPSSQNMNYCPGCGRPLVEQSEADLANPLRAKVVARGDEEDV